jgi:3-oxoacyl-[acyl-carrier protein] reductase
VITESLIASIHCSIDEKKLSEVVAEIQSTGGDVIGVPGDVGADDFPKKIVQATVRCALAEYIMIPSLTPPKEIWKNKSYHQQRFVSLSRKGADFFLPSSLPAGFTFDKMIHTTPDNAFDIILKIHLRAPFRLIREAAPYFRLKVSSMTLNSSINLNIVIYIRLYLQPDQRENRSIINVSSTTGLHGNVGQANYAAGKAGVIGLTKTLAKEWGRFGVRANTVAFGLIHTR